MKRYICIKKNKQSGVALIQVLLICAMITILAIHFSFTAREQVATASALEKRVKVTQALKSIQSKIIYTLLTQDNFEEPMSVFPNSEAWNFYGKVFTLEQTKTTKVLVTIQDNNGLLSQQYIGGPYWTKALINMGFTSDEVNQKQGVIKDWQDKDNSSWLAGNTEPNELDNGQQYRNQAIQLQQEIDWFFEKEPNKLDIIKQISTPYAMASFNPMTAPETLLMLFFQSEIAAKIIKERENNSLTKSELINLLGNDYDNVTISLFRGTEFKITIQVNFDDVQSQETLEIKLQPSENEPILILARY